jgi:DNA polymerase I-like protein with 3'-5' exonuclease and polymerase domains
LWLHKIKSKDDNIESLLDDSCVSDNDREVAKILCDSFVFGFDTKYITKKINAVGKFSFPSDQSSNHLHRSIGSILREDFLREFDGVRNFIESSVISVKKLGFIETIFGRKKTFEYEINEFDIIKSLLKMSSADIIKLALVNLHYCFQNFNESNKQQIEIARIAMNFHDTLVLEVPKQSKKEIETLVKECIFNCVNNFQVEFQVEFKSGDTWDSI